MSETVQTEGSCGEYKTDAPWCPMKKWWQLSQIFYPDVGLPPVLEPWEPGLKSRPAACSWPGFVSVPLFVPYVSEPTPCPDQDLRKWRVNMDLARFRPADISLRVGGGFLEVRGSHEERPDEHGFITRCFSRKYRLPAEVDVAKLVSTFSVDGILTVEAPVPEASAPATIIIPIKVEVEEQEVEDKEEEEVHDDQDQPSSTRAENEQKDEEKQEQTAEETHPSAPAEDENLESLQKSEQQKAPESLEGPGTSTQLEPKEPVTDDGEIQVKEEGGEELTQPEEQDLGSSPPGDVQSQELEAADIKQELVE